MNISELRQKSKPELEKMLQDTKEKLRNLNFSIQLKQSKNVREVRKTKKLIAQIFNILKIK